MKKKIIMKFLVFIMPCLVIAQQFDLPTYDATVMPWSKEYWYHLSPTSTTLTQDMSGEDWPYRVIKDGSGTSAKYVLVGYARGTGEGDNSLNTCNTNGTTHKVGGTIVKLDNDGDILWNKLYAEKGNPPPDNPNNPLDWTCNETTELHGLVKTTETVEGISTEYYIATGFTSILHRFPHNANSSTPNPPSIREFTRASYINILCTTGGNTFRSWVNGDNRRVIYVVKVKASDGSIVWERTYNTANSSDYTSSACDNYRAMGWDIEVLSNGNYLVVGCAPNMSATQNFHWKNEGQSTKNMQMYMMELKPNGERVWIQIYDPAAGTGFTAERWSVAYAIARKPGTNDFAITGRFLTDQGWAFPFGSSATTRSRCFVGKFTYAGGGTAPTITYKALDNTTFDAGINDNLNNLATEVDFSIEADPKILVPMISNCTECYDSWTGDAEGRVIALNYSALTKAYCTNALPDIESFDLRMGITPTSDGGSAVISSKIPFRLPFLARKFGWKTAKVGSDATAAKLNASGVVTKCMTFDAQNVNGFCPKDAKEQECLYSIIENVESGTPYYVICGNTSSNADDHYAVKFKFDCPSGTGISDIGGNTDLTSIIRPCWKKIINSSAYSSNPSTSNVIDIRAGKTIHLTPGFRAQSNGGVTHLHIDTFRCDECD
ncbi:MAG: hypothetical protein ACK5C0_10045 [Candidatus Kapaibacterium sp.]|jgi:hypothetical protein